MSQEWMFDEIKVLVEIIRLLSTLPSDRSRGRILEYIRDRFTEDLAERAMGGGFILDENE